MGEDMRAASTRHHKVQLTVHRPQRARSMGVNRSIKFPSASVDESKCDFPLRAAIRLRDRFPSSETFAAIGLAAAKQANRGGIGEDDGDGSAGGAFKGDGGGCDGGRDGSKGGGDGDGDSGDGDGSGGKVTGNSQKVRSQNLCVPA